MFKNLNTSKNKKYLFNDKKNYHEMKKKSNEEISQMKKS